MALTELHNVYDNIRIISCRAKSDVVPTASRVTFEELLRKLTKVKTLHSRKYSRKETKQNKNDFTTKNSSICAVFCLCENIA